MCYTEEQIEKYLEILNNYKKTEDVNRKVRCWNCQSDCFSIYSGYKICEECGGVNDHVLGYYDQKDHDRLYF